MLYLILALLFFLGIQIGISIFIWKKIKLIKSLGNFSVKIDLSNKDLKIFSYNNSNITFYIELENLLKQLILEIKNYDFDFLKKQIYSFIKKEFDIIDNLISLPLYAGLGGTITGILIGFKGLHSISQDYTQFITDISYALLVSLCGILFVGILSFIKKQLSLDYIAEKITLDIYSQIASNIKTKKSEIDELTLTTRDLKESISEFSEAINQFQNNINIAPLTELAGELRKITEINNTLVTQTTQTLKQFDIIPQELSKLGSLLQKTESSLDTFKNDFSNFANSSIETLKNISDTTTKEITDLSGNIQKSLSNFITEFKNEFEKFSKKFIEEYNSQSSAIIDKYETLINKIGKDSQNLIEQFNKETNKLQEKLVDSLATTTNSLDKYFKNFVSAVNNKLVDLSDNINRLPTIEELRHLEKLQLLEENYQLSLSTIDHLKDISSVLQQDGKLEKLEELLEQHNQTIEKQADEIIKIKELLQKLPKTRKNKQKKSEKKSFLKKLKFFK